MDFEVSEIENHIVINNNTILYNVRWKACYYNSSKEFLPWLNHVKNITKIYISNGNNKNVSCVTQYKVEWKNSWLPTESLEGCDEILPAYILSNMKRSADTVVAQQMLKMKKSNYIFLCTLLKLILSQ
eukprot:447515_1